MGSGQQPGQSGSGQQPGQSGSGQQPGQTGGRKDRPFQQDTGSKYNNSKTNRRNRRFEKDHTKHQEQAGTVDEEKERKAAEEFDAKVKLLDHIVKITFMI